MTLREIFKSTGFWFYFAIAILVGLESAYGFAFNGAYSFGPEGESLKAAPQRFIFGFVIAGIGLLVVNAG